MRLLQGQPCHLLRSCRHTVGGNLVPDAAGEAMHRGQPYARAAMEVGLPVAAQARLQQQALVVAL